MLLGSDGGQGVQPVKRGRAPTRDRITTGVGVACGSAGGWGLGRPAATVGPSSVSGSPRVAGGRGILIAGVGNWALAADALFSWRGRWIGRGRGRGRVVLAVGLGADDAVCNPACVAGRASRGGF